jgi:hypothetical protein
MKRPPTNTCPRCGQRLLAPDETAQHSRPHLVQVHDGHLQMRCPTRQCGLWVPASPRFLALLRTVLLPQDEPCWKE